MRPNAIQATSAAFVVVCPLCALAWGAPAPDAPCPACGPAARALEPAAPFARVVVAIANPGADLPKGFQP